MPSGQRSQGSSNGKGGGLQSHASQSNGSGEARLESGLLIDLHATACRAAAKAGALVATRFGGSLQVSSKVDEVGKSLVTDVDRESQRLITEIVAERFPDHMVLGEEDAHENEPAAREFVWAVDPIDGTTNFINGLPIHAISVAALHRGRPVAGAVWAPWPRVGGYTMFHGYLSGGAWRDKQRLTIKTPDNDGEPTAGRLSGLSLGLPFTYRVGQPFRRRHGEPRSCGSATLEVCMVAAGIMEFSVTGPAQIWDFAAATLLVSEAGGVTLATDERGAWAPFTGWGASYAFDQETSRRMRSWRKQLICASPKTAAFIAANLKPRRRGLMHRITRKLRSAMQGKVR